MNLSNENIATAQNGFWILPSRARPKSLERFFKAAVELRMSTFGYVLVGEEDFELRKAEYSKLDLPSGWSLINVPESEEHSQANKIRWFEKAREYRSAFWIGWLNDDGVPLTEKWDTKLIAKLNGKNYVSGTDGWQPHRIHGGFAATRALLDVIGGLYPTGFNHSYVDDLLEDVGRATKCWDRVPEVKWHHIHHLKKESEYDSTYKQNDSYLAEDDKRWVSWIKNERTDTVRRVKKFIEGEK